jgi:hypothetical protein
MSLTLAVALAATTALPSCSWDRPGHNPFMGDVVAAVERYTDIPAQTRQRLKRRMAARAYDEIVTIGRDAITGRALYDSAIRDMHFGQGQVCATVTRSRWQAGMQERGLVYCEDSHCILVPTVCRNVSRIQRLAPAGAVAPAAGGGAGGGGQAAATAADDPAAELVTALELAPPGAGLGQVPGSSTAEGSFARGANLPSLALPAGAGLPLTASADSGPAARGQEAGLPEAPGLAGAADGFWIAGVGAPAPDLPPPDTGSAAGAAGFVPAPGGAGGPLGAGGLVFGAAPPGDLAVLLPGGIGAITPAIPEPGTAVLLGLGGLMLWARQRRRRG